MLFHMKDHKAAVLENDLNKLQKEGPAAWADLPEDELFPRRVQRGACRGHLLLQLQLLGQHLPCFLQE